MLLVAIITRLVLLLRLESEARLLWLHIITLSYIYSQLYSTNIRDRSTHHSAGEGHRIYLNNMIIVRYELSDEANMHPPAD